MDQELFKKFSANLKKTLVLSEKLASEQGIPTDTGHFLIALSMSKGTLAFELLNSFKLTTQKIELTLSLGRKAKTNPYSKELVSTEAKEAIQLAVAVASKHSHYSVDCEHLLLAIAKEKRFKSFQTIEKLGCRPTEIATQIEFVFKTINDNLGNRDNPDDEMREIPEEMHGPDMFGPIDPIGNISLASKVKKESILESFSTNITKLAANDKLDEVIGRDSETTRVIQILSRRTKNNPILVGEPGVGKSAIVEGLAKRIIEGKVPEKLLNKEILSLDMGSLIAGTMYRGQFESRVKKIISEIKKKGNIIVFIDEIHTVVGAGSTEGSIDAANLLKPMLSRGELRLIGATTIDEYKKHIEKDAAFERRFQPVKIMEPTVEETIKILEGIKNKYEEHHNITYTKEAMVAAANLAQRYINDRFLPDKAIDLIDEAAAAANISISKDAYKLMSLKKNLRAILRQKEELILNENYKDATLLRRKEIILEDKIKNLKIRDQLIGKKIIDEENIGAIISKWTGIPVSNLNLQEKKKFLNLEKKLSSQVIGQEEAVSEITKAIKRARVGISNPNRPMGTFIFLGPTGVGKTELAKVLAKEILGSSQNLIKIDMSEFMEKHNVSRLVGAPAGYIGYEEGGKLTEAIRKNPYSIILLDEIEKAHPEVFNILLQVMEDGELTDAKGRNVDFKNTIIIMTSNLGTDILTKQAVIGFNKSSNLDEKYEKLESSVKETVEKHFKPEFLNRLDKIIIFKPLDKAVIKKIVELELEKLKKRLKKRYSLRITPNARDWIAEKGHDPNYGARPIRKIIADFIETNLSELILGETITEGDLIEIDTDKDKLVLSKVDG